MRLRLQDNAARAIALAAVFFGGLAALAFVNGVFDRLGAELTATLAAFALGFALLTWHLDPAVRAFVRRLFARGSVKPARDRAATV